MKRRKADSWVWWKDGTNNDKRSADEEDVKSPDSKEKKGSLLSKNKVMNLFSLQFKA